MKRKKVPVSQIYNPNGKVINVIELKGRDGKKTLKMQPRGDSLREEEKIILGHTKDQRIDHLNGYQKKQGKMLQYKVSLKLVKYRDLPLPQTPIPLLPGESILAISGNSLPPSILVSGGSVYPSGVFGSGVTLYVGSVDYYTGPTDY